VTVTLLAVSVGAVVTAAAAFSGAGGCAAPGPGPGMGPTPVDDVCYQLVRTLAERAGLLTAVMTAILVLTVIGLSRMMADAEGQARSTDRMA
jgi:hypothetical protein